MPRFAPILAAVLFLPSPVFALSNPDAKVLIHLAPPVGKVGCTAQQAKPRCSEIGTEGDLLPETYFAYVLATDAAACHGIAGIQFGVTYDNVPGSGVDVYSWTACAPVSFSSAGWPASGSGLVVSWDPVTACQRFEPDGDRTGATATAGYFYMAAYTADQMRISGHPMDGRVKVTDCNGDVRTVFVNGSVSTPVPVGHASFSSGAAIEGYSPCGRILHPFGCLVLGLPTLTVGQTAEYLVEAATCNNAVLWGITGDASIVGPNVGPSVTVRADAVGSFTLGATGSDVWGGFITCGVDVPVVAPGPDCTITGPSSVSAGSSASYSALPYPGTFAWTIAGNGSITGPANLPEVTVLAGGAGSYQLGLTITVDGVSSTCSRTVTVSSSNCAPLGFDAVFPAPAVNPYFAGPDSTGQFSWSISGNGTIVGSTMNWQANVQAGPAAGGPFTLQVQITRSATVTVCSKIVDVLEPAPPPPGGNARAKIMLHLVPPAPVGCDLGGCCRFGATRPCSTLTTKGALYPALYYAALLVVDGETDGSPYSGIHGVRLGIDYDGATGQGVDIYHWTVCAALHFPTGGWPEAGGGNLVVFDPVESCQRGEPAGAGTGVSAQFGYFYLAAYTPDRLSITTDPGSGRAVVIDCGGRETTIEGGGVPASPSPLGYLSFSAGATTPGYNPCNLVIPVRNTTWSGIKGLFREEAAGGGNRPGGTTPDD